MATAPTKSRIFVAVRFAAGAVVSVDPRRARPCVTRSIGAAAFRFRESVRLISAFNDLGAIPTQFQDFGVAPAFGLFRLEFVAVRAVAIVLVVVARPLSNGGPKGSE